MAKQNSWTSHAGYREAHQLVSPTGRILAEVSGSQFHKEKGWTAVAFPHARMPLVLGRYVNLAAAKAALEDLLEAQPKTNLTW